MINKICPMLLSGTLANPAPEDKSVACLEDRCAWWDADFGGCGMVSQALRASRQTARDEARAEKY